MDEACTTRRLLPAAVPYTGTDGDECATRPRAEGSPTARFGQPCTSGSVGTVVVIRVTLQGAT